MYMCVCVYVCVYIYTYDAAFQVPPSSPYDGQFEAIWQLATTAMCLPILVYDK